MIFYDRKGIASQFIKNRFFLYGYLLFFIFISISIEAQDLGRDRFPHSLKHRHQSKEDINLLLSQLSTESAVSLKAEKYCKILVYYYYNNTEKYEAYGDSLINFSIKNKYQKGIAKGYSFKSWAHNSKGEYLKGIYCLEKSLKIHTEAKDLTGINRVYYSLGSLNFYRENYRQAIIDFDKSISLSKQTSNNKLLIKSYIALSNVYRDYKKSGLGIFYAKKAINLIDKKEKTKERLVHHAIFSLATSYFVSKKYKDAEILLDNLICSEKISKQTFTLSKIYLSQIFLVRKEFKKALSYVKDIEKKAYASKKVFIIKKMLSAKYQIFKESKQYKKALLYHEKLEALNKKNDAIDKNFSFELFTKLKIVKTESEKLILEKDNQLINLAIKKQKTITIIIVTSIIVLIFLLLILYDSYLEKKTVNKTLILNEQSLTKKNQEFQESNRIKNKMFTVISNDINLPIKNLQKMMFLFNTEALTYSKSELKTRTLYLNEATNKIEQKLKKVIDWMSLNATEDKVVFDDTLIFKLINNLIKKELSATLNKKNIVVCNRINPILSLFTNKDILKIVLQNLINNAIAVSEKDTDIEVSLKKANAHHKIIINTYPIQNKTQHINSPSFHEVNPKTIVTTKPQEENMNIILSKKLIEDIAGQIVIKKNSDSSTSFIILLPHM